MNKKFYLAMWRWHFFAGLYVVPFMLMLCITGLLMLASPWTDPWQYGDQLTRVSDATENSSVEKHSAQQQMETVKAAYPDYRVTQYIPPATDTHTSQFKLRGQTPATKSAGSVFVFVDPYQNTITGEFNNSDRLYTIGDDIHGTLMIGKVGDALIELSAGLTILLVITGLYLHWPNSLQLSFLNVRTWHSAIGQKKRSAWKDIHGSMGFYLAIFLFFFALTGMAWTGIWGQKLVQPFSSFPAEKRASFWSSDLASKNSSANLDNTHAQLNTDELNEVPWNLEQTPLPTSNAPLNTNKALTLDQVIDKAHALGFKADQQSGSIFADGFRLALPQKPEGVFTLMAVTSSGDISNPFGDRTLHLDQYSGQVLGDIRWDDYNLGAKAMAAGIALHKGRAGWWNLILAAVVCLLIVLLSISGTILWWKRRTSKQSSALNAPPLQQDQIQTLKELPAKSKTLVAIMLLTGVLFPVTGAAMIAFLMIELFVIYLSAKSIERSANA